MTYKEVWWCVDRAFGWMESEDGLSDEDREAYQIVFGLLKGKIEEEEEGNGSTE